MENEPYAFHLEGFAASNDPKFFPSDGEKQARFNFSIGIHGPADEMLAHANGDYDKGNTYTTSEFVDPVWQGYRGGCQRSPPQQRIRSPGG